MMSLVLVENWEEEYMQEPLKWNMVAPAVTSQKKFSRYSWIGLTLGNAIRSQSHVLHSTFNHSNIVKFVGILFYDEDTTVPKLVMEKMDSYLMGLAMQNKLFPLPKLLSLLHDVSLAVCYLHSQTPPLIHRDLTTISVLVNSIATVAKISDFLRIYDNSTS